MSWASNNVSSCDYSWSAFASIVTPKFPPPCCICKRPYVISTSRTLKNPNRLFYCCPLYKEKKSHCGTFVWVDIYEAQMEQERLKEMEMEMEMEMGDGRIPQVEMEITEMKAKMNEMQVKMLLISKDVVYLQRSFGVVIGIVLVFVVMVMIFYVWK